ncbi:MAG: sterol desaturase family protein, partial [bacterium]
MNLLFGLALLGALFAVLEGYWPAETGRRRLRGGLRTDLFYWFLTPLVTRPLTGVAIALGLVAAALLAGTPLSAEEISRFLAPHGLVQTLPRWVQVVAFFLLADLLGYLAHRLLHGRHLWLVHAVHHSSREVDWLSSVRAHPLNDLFTRSLQAVP